MMRFMTSVYGSIIYVFDKGNVMVCYYLLLLHKLVRIPHTLKAFSRSMENQTSLAWKGQASSSHEN